MKSLGLRGKVLWIFLISFLVSLLLAVSVLFLSFAPLFQVVSWEWQQLLLIVLVIIAGLFLIMFSAGRVILNQISNPLRDLTRVVEQFSRQDFKEKLHIDSEDELGVLSRGLNQMAVNLDTQLRELTQGKSQLETVLSNMEEGVLVTTRYREILLMNEAFKVLFQTSLPPKTKTVLEHLRNVGLEDSLRETAEQGTRMTREMVLARKPPVMLEVNTSPILVSGKTRGIVAVFHDITKMRQAENEQRDFIQNASHELKTPLTVIKGYIESLLEDPLDQPDRTKKTLRILKKNADRLESLISDILDLSRIEAEKTDLKVSPLDLKGQIEQVLSEFEAKASEKKIRLASELPQDLPKVLMSELHFDQILSNLVDNAVKYSGEETTVTVRVLPDAQAGLILQVEDQGIGISEEERHRVFERFYRVDKARSRASGGTGLGLSIARTLVENYGGSISVTSKPGQGSVFYVSLPKNGGMGGGKE